MSERTIICPQCGNVFLCSLGGIVTHNCRCGHVWETGPRRPVMGDIVIYDGEGMLRPAIVTDTYNWPGSISEPGLVDLQIFGIHHEDNPNRNRVKYRKNDDGDMEYCWRWREDQAEIDRVR